MIPLFMYQSDGWDGWHVWKIEFMEHFQIYSSTSPEHSFSIYAEVIHIHYRALTKDGKV